MWCIEQYPIGSCVCFESRRVFSCSTAEPGCSSQWLYCVKGVLSMLLCAHWEIFPLAVFKTGWGKKHAYRCPLTDAHALTCVRNEPLRHTHAHAETLGSGQWRATAQDVHVTSCVCEEFFGVTVETRCNSEISPLCGSSLSVEKNQSIRESQALSPTLAAAARLSAMIHGKDRVYANAMLVDQVSHTNACGSFKYKKYP